MFSFECENKILEIENNVDLCLLRFKWYKNRENNRERKKSKLSVMKGEWISIFIKYQ